MQTILIVVHLMIVLALVGVVLLQRSEGGALGVGGGSGFMTGRGQANVLTRATAILAALFFATSLGLTLMARYGNSSKSVFEGVSTPKPQGTVLDQLRRVEEQRSRDKYKAPGEAPAQTPPANPSPAKPSPTKPSAPAAPDTTSSGSRPPSMAPTEPAGTPDKPASESPTAPKPAAPAAPAQTPAK